MGKPMPDLDADHIFAHLASVMAVAGALVGWLPSVVALVALGWYALQIYESRTVTSWLHRRKHRRRK